MDAMKSLGNSDSTQYIVIQMGEEQYGIDIKYIENIVRMQNITRVPDVQSYFNGVINLRGEVVPVMSLRRKLGLLDDEITNSTRIIIIKLENAPVGVIVDEVKEVVMIDEDEVDSVTTSKKDETTYIKGIGKTNEGLISLLDLDKVISD